MAYHKKIKNRWLYILLLIFSFFPYIQLIPLGTDSQPNTLLVAALIFLLSFKGRTPKIFWGLLLVAIGSMLVFFIPPINFGSFRSLSNYLGLFIIAFTTNLALYKLGGLPFKLFRNVVYLWFIVGTVQLFIYPEFLSFLLPRGDTEKLLLSGRGINCLTPEPTFYGMTCIILGMTAYINFKGKYKLNHIYILLFIQLFLYSRSTLSIFLLMAAFIFYYGVLLFRKMDFTKSIFRISLIALAVAGLIIYAEDFLVEYRVGRLLVLLLENPKKFLILDSSVNERFVHLFFPVYAFVTDLGIPHGFNTFNEYMQHCFMQPQFNEIITQHVVDSEINRILSGLGGTLYELGIIGFIFIIYLYKLFKSTLRGKDFLIVFALFIFIMTNAMTFSNPMIAFFLGNIVYIHSLRISNETKEDISD